MIKQNDIIEYIAQDYATAETVGKVDETTVFVPYLIKGEKALVRINYAKRGVAYGDVVKLTESSPKRVAPPCPHYGVCGGCTTMHMSYAEQLEFKRNKVASNLAKIGKMQVNVLPCVPSPLQYGYRNKLSLPVGGKVGNVRIGMYKRASHDVVQINNCLLGGSWATKLVQIVTQYLNNAQVVPYNERTFDGEIRHVVARFVCGQLLVILVSNGKFRHDTKPLADALRTEFGENFGLFINVNEQHNNVIMGKQTHHVCGLQCISGEHLGVKFKLQAESFFQVNDGIKDGIYRKVRELLDTSNTQVLVELFSGVGILTCTVASDKYDTYAVEIVPSATADADEQKRLNNTPRLTNICGDANVELPKIIAQNADKVMSLVVDPPRKGLGENICKLIAEAQFDNVVYVSCDSATLARDLALLAPHYDIAYCQPWDMFPNTDQCEVLCLLQRNFAL